MQVWSLGQEDSLEEGMATHATFLPEESHQQRSLAGYSPQGLSEWYTTKRINTLTIYYKLKINDKEKNVKNIII